jgi:hypothetical protein
MMMNANLKNQVETFGQFCGRKWPLLCSGDVTLSEQIKFVWD